MEEDPSTPETIRDREKLIVSRGDITLAPRPPVTDEELDEELDSGPVWRPPLDLRLEPLGSIDLPGSVVVCSPELAHDRPIAGELTPGPYEVVGARDPRARLTTSALMVRLNVEPVERWEHVCGSADDHLVIVPAGRSESWIGFPGRAEPGVVGAAEWVRPGTTSCGRPFLWLSNPRGNRLQAYVGIRSQAIEAVFVEFH